MPIQNIRTYRRKLAWYVNAYWVKHGIPARYKHVCAVFSRPFRRCGYELQPSLIDGECTGVHAELGIHGGMLLFPAEVWELMPVVERDYWLNAGARGVPIAKRYVEDQAPHHVEAVPNSSMHAFIPRYIKP